MHLVDEFTLWLKRWFSEDEAKAIVGGSWKVEDGVTLNEKLIMNIEEFLQLAATFAVERALGRSSGVKVLAKYNEVCAFDIKTRTVLIAAAYRHAAVSANKFESLLNDMVRQAEESRDFYMGLRSVVC